MASKTIAQVTAISAVQGAYKVPISTGDSQAHTATMDSIKAFCRQGATNWDEIQNKPTFSTVAYTGSYNDLTDTPTIPTVNDATLTITQGGVQKGTFTANASSNVTIALDNGVAEQTIVTKTVTTDTLDVAANTVYKYTNPLTSLTISSFPDPSQTTLESIIYFSTEGTNGCQLNFTNRPNYLFGAIGQLMPGCQYVITIKDGCVSVSTPNYVEPWTVETLTVSDGNGGTITRRFMIANN